jgi:hypothetical protein
MKKQLFVALTLVAIFCSAAFPQTTSKYSPYKQIDFNWSYTPNLPACTSTAKACFMGFTLKDTTSGTTLVTPSTLGPTTLSYSYFPAGGVQYGVHKFLLTANGYDETGAPTVSAGATVTVTVAVPSLVAPTKLVGAMQ